MQRAAKANEDDVRPAFLDAVPPFEPEPEPQPETETEPEPESSPEPEPSPESWP